MYEEAASTADVISECDVIYMEPVVQADYTQSRVERDDDELGLTPEAYCVTRELLREKAKPSSIILHSLPRMDELLPDVDATRHQRYWVEAFNGVVMRMALISLVARSDGIREERWTSSSTASRSRSSYGRTNACSKCCASASASAR